jgi:ribosomal protein S18 acetylase RimI-like enzyme
LVKIAIRAYDRRDAAGTAEVFYRSAREVALSDYTVAQVKAWVPGPLDPVREHQRSSDGRLVLVAVDEDDRVVAFIDLEADGHIDRLYCAPEAAGRGIASQLYDTLEAQHGRSFAGWTFITTQCSRILLPQPTRWMVAQASPAPTASSQPSAT